MRGFVWHHQPIEEHAIEVGVCRRPALLLWHEDVTGEEDQARPALTKVAWHLCEGESAERECSDAWSEVIDCCGGFRCRNSSSGFRLRKRDLYGACAIRTSWRNDRLDDRLCRCRKAAFHAWRRKAIHLYVAGGYLRLLIMSQIEPSYRYWTLGDPSRDVIPLYYLLRYALPCGYQSPLLRIPELQIEHCHVESQVGKPVSSTADIEQASAGICQRRTRVDKAQLEPLPFLWCCRQDDSDVVIPFSSDVRPLNGLFLQKFELTPIFRNG